MRFGILATLKLNMYLDRFNLWLLMEARNLICCLPAQHFSNQYFTQSCYQIVSIYFVNRFNKYSFRSSQSNVVFNHITVDSCTSELLDETVFPITSSTKIGTTVNEHVWVVLFQIWLSCQTCVSLFDDDSFSSKATRS